MRNRTIWQRRGLAVAVISVLLVLVTACTEDELTASRASVASVSLSPAGATMLTGDRLRLTATLLDADRDTLLSRQIAWSVSDEGVASVDETGLVTAVAAGAATVTATSEGIAGSMLLSVEKKPEPVGFIGYADPAARFTACGICHAEEQTEWRGTNHSEAWAGLQTSDLAEEGCELCHTVTERGNAVEQIGGYELTSDQRFYDVQCESCHGPGQAHAVAADPGAEPPHASIAEGGGMTSGCGECHTFLEQPQLEEWEQSVMAQIPNYAIAAATDDACLDCHEGKTALMKRFGVTADYAEKAEDSPLPIVCVVCHDPHSSEFEADLRVSPSDTADHLCLRCHAHRATPPSQAGPHAAQGSLLLGNGGYTPPGYEDQVDAGRHVTAHGPVRNLRLCVTCHLPKFSGASLYRYTGHTFDAIPCQDSRGEVTPGPCPDEERYFQACARSGCHGGPGFAMAVDYWGRWARHNQLLDQLWLDSDGDRVIDATDGGLLAQLVALGDTLQFVFTDDSVTLGEGALWNAQLAFTADRTHFADGEVLGMRFSANKSSGNGVHNPFLLEALLLTSIKALEEFLEARR